MSNLNQSSTSAKKTNYDYILKELGAVNLTTVYMPELPEHKRIAVFIIDTLGFEKYQKTGEKIVNDLILRVGIFNGKYESNSFSDSHDCCIVISKILEYTFAQLDIEPTEENITVCLDALFPNNKIMYHDWLRTCPKHLIY